MAASGLFDTRFLNSARIQTIVETAASYLERTRPLTFLDRLELKNATDDELMGRFTGRVIAADIIADGQKALVYESGQIQLFTTGIPNVKIGQSLSQAQLNLLNRLSEGMGRAAEEDAAFDWERTFGENLVQGVRERMNAMACAMMIDNFSYDRWGIKMSGATWGMPANLKVTPTALWSLDSGATANANATPISDIFALDTVDSQNYGLGPFDRITMSTKALNYMTSTTEFANKAWVALAAAFLPTTAAITPSLRERKDLAERVFAKQIVIDDKTYREVTNDGTPNAVRVLPENKVLLDRTTNGTREWDFGNAVVTESLVAAMIGGMTIGTNPRMEMGGGSYGPVGYYTAQDSQINPPGVIGWAVARAFPRKHVSESSAVITLW